MVDEMADPGFDVGGGEDAEEGGDDDSDPQGNVGGDDDDDDDDVDVIIDQQEHSARPAWGAPMVGSLFMFLSVIFFICSLLFCPAHHSSSVCCFCRSIASTFAKV